MIGKRRNCLLLFLATTLTGVAAGQSDPPTDPPKPNEGFTGLTFRLTPLMLDQLLDRATERMVEEFGLDEEQARQASAVLKEQVPKFLKENQNELENLYVGFMEARLRNEAPSQEQVAAWAQNALPMLEKARGLISGMSEQLRENLDDEQQVRMDAALAAFNVAANSTTGRLMTWSDGGFDAATEWDRNPEARKIDRQRAREIERAMKAARNETLERGGLPMRGADGAAAHQAHAGGASGGTELAAAQTPGPKGATTSTREKDEWERFVDEFIARYQLNADQSQRAHLFRTEAARQRDDYLRGKGKSMEEIEKLFKQAKTPEETASAEARYQELNKPIERMFGRLKEKLETLPTRDQRKKAAQGQAAAPADGSQKSGPK